MTSGRLDRQSVLNQVERPLVCALVVSYDVQASFGTVKSTPSSWQMRHTEVGWLVYNSYYQPCLGSHPASWGAVIHENRLEVK
jgi:hypothetical protein